MNDAEIEPNDLRFIVKTALHKSVKLVTGLLAPSLKLDDLAWGTEMSLHLIVDMETIFVPATHPAHPARPPIARGRKGSRRAAITQATSRETSHQANSTLSPGSGL
jgi:hypothetical protein